MANLVTKCCPVCFVDYAIPELMSQRYKDHGGSWHCPNGHSLSYTTLEIDKVRQERDRLAQQAAQKDDEIRLLREGWNEAEKRATAATRKAKKLQTRAAAGVCPCCNRTFVALQRHMQAKHPDFKTAEVVAIKAS